MKAFLLLSCLLAAPTALAATSDVFGGAGEPRFVAYPMPDSLPNAGQAGEPSIGIPPNTNSVFFQAFTSTYRVTFTEDVNATATWTDVTPAFSRTNIDPLLYVDTIRNRIYQGGLNGPCSIMGISDDDGETWVPSRNMCNGALFDHQSIGAGAWPVNDTHATLTERAVYYCSQAGLEACSTSIDGGATWLPPVIVQGECLGLHGHIQVSETDGFAVLPNRNCAGRVGYAATADGGVTWTSHQIPASKTADSFDPAAAFTPAGWLWFAHASASGAHVALSKDDGATWERLGRGSNSSEWFNVGALYRDPLYGTPIRFGAFANVAAGDDDRVAFTFLGSTHPLGRYPFSDCTAGSDHNIWHYYAAMSLDAGQSWNVTRLTQDPVQVGGIWNSGDGGECRNLLDFNDMHIDAYGRIVIAFADGCIEACATKYLAYVQGEGPAPVGADSRAAHGTILRQATGPGLLAEWDIADIPLVDPVPSSTSSRDAPSPIGALALVGALAIRRVIANRTNNP